MEEKKRHDEEEENMILMKESEIDDFGSFQQETEAEEIQEINHF
ncbi:hypothetical protein AVEN_8421-1, partial [Araneus ventricosus]